MDLAFEYVKNHPIMTEEDYPYIGHQERCTYQEGKGVAKVKEYKDVAEGDSD